MHATRSFYDSNIPDGFEFHGRFPDMPGHFPDIIFS
jgi:hypothetical protein